MALRHDYFIIESLGPGDIKDGEIFWKGLESLNTYDPIYRPVNTPEEFTAALIEFQNSDYDCLFVSSHGDEVTLDLTGGIYETFDLEDAPVDLQNRRVFMSTCRGGTELFARHFIRKGAYSVIGAPDDLAQIVATGMWVTMAWIFERYQKERLSFVQLNGALAKLAKVYGIELAYYSFMRRKRQMKEYTYFPDKKRNRRDLPL